MAHRAILLCLLAALVAAPLASAHTQYVSPDGKISLVVGNLNEPVTTYMKTGLDLIVRDNNTAKTEIGGLAGSIQATLIAPDGVATLSKPVVLQFGTTGRYTFSEPYYLTQPGQYKVHVVADVKGTHVDATINVAGPIPAMENVTFPDSHAANAGTLRDQVGNLNDEVAAMKVRLNSLEASRASGSKGAPSLAAVPGFALLLAAVAVAARRRAD